MPSISTAPSDDILEPFESFAVINRDNLPSLADGPGAAGRMALGQSLEAAAARQRNVNIVKPVQRKPQHDIEDHAFLNQPSTGDRRNENNTDEPVNQGRKRLKTMEVMAPSQTILDPRFSRNLDLKLRRLKEKEIIAERISRRAKERSKVVIPKIEIRSVPPNTKRFTRSNPNVSLVKPNIVNLEIKEMGKNYDNKSERSTSGENEVKFPELLKYGSNRKTTQSHENIVNNRPLFITTVKKGQFLPPPPEMASLLGLEGYLESTVGKMGGGLSPLVYSYASRPKVLGAAARLTAASIPAPVARAPGLAPPAPNKPGLGGAARALAALASLAASTAAIGSSGCPAMPHGNAMSDRRVVRGSTMSFGSMGGGGGGGGDAAAEARRRAVARRRAPRSTAPPDNMPYKAVQTEPYLEELFDKGEEFDVGVQTDMLVERPSTPKFVPCKIGYDVATQIMPGDLFDFDEEVASVLEVLVGKTVEQSLVEVLEEEELAAVRRRAEEQAERRNAAAASATHHQRHLVRMHRQKERRVEEAAMGAEAARSAAQRAAAAALVRAHLPALLPAVLRALQDQGYLQPDQDPGVDEGFMPWLMSEVAQEVESMITSRDVLADIVREVLETRAEVFRAMGEGHSSSGRSSTRASSEEEASHHYNDIGDQSGNASDA